jgi:hypothetical protein
MIKNENYIKLGNKLGDCEIVVNGQNITNKVTNINVSLSANGGRIVNLTLNCYEFNINIESIVKPDVNGE